MAGPATNAATITLIGKVLGKKSLIGYLGAIITGALLSGLLLITFCPSSWFIISEHFGHMAHNHSMLPGWLKIGSAITLTLLNNKRIFSKIFKFKTNEYHRTCCSRDLRLRILNTIIVGGMTCNHCKANVENSIKSAPGVEDVAVDLATGKVNITGESIDLDEIKTGIESIGYTVVKSKLIIRTLSQKYH